MTKELNHKNSPEDEKKIPNQRFSDRYIRIFVRLFALFISLVITYCFLHITGEITDYFYYRQHPESIGVDDLGVVPSMLLWAMITFPLALILFPLLYCFFSEKISKLLGGR